MSSLQPYAEHMLHRDNLKSVLQNGLLSHNAAYDRRLISRDISMDTVQARRSGKIPAVDGFPNFQHGLHDLVSFYFNSKNPMLYVRKSIQQELFILLIGTDILDASRYSSRYAIFSDGNAGASATKFFFGKSNLSNVDLSFIAAGSWNHEDENIKKEQKRKMCAEILIYPDLPSSFIQKIICPNSTMLQYANDAIKSVGYSANHIIAEQSSGYFF